jgi:UDP-2,4-diacetamido-2,4,6-trideoxy-beta-L-altropyranose hydrolase
VTLRAATDRDSPLLLEWRNDPDAMRFSVSGRRVTPSEHKRWFAGIRSDQSRTSLWIAEEHGTPVGQIRVDVTDGVGVVSIAIAAQHRGRGIGSEVLRILVDEITAGGRVRLLRALSHPDNSRSLRAFERAGFRPAAATEHGFILLERLVGR